MAISTNSSTFSYFRPLSAFTFAGAAINFALQKKSVLIAKYQ